MKYSNLSQIELDGLLIGVTDLYRLYNPSAIPSDEPPNISSRRYSLSSSDDNNYLNEPSETYNPSFSTNKQLTKEEIKKARENKENQQRRSSKYIKLEALNESDSKISNARNELVKSREKDNSIFENLGMIVDNILGKKRLKKIDYNSDIELAPTFSEYLNSLIQEKGLDNSEVYKAAQIDRRHFSKIISETFYKPKRDTVLSFIIALKLNIEEAKDLMATAGYIFSKSNKRDIVFEYFIRIQNYNINDINEVLCEFNLDLFNL